jgi:hypothetical protein
VPKTFCRLRLPWGIRSAAVSVNDMKMSARNLSRPAFVSLLFATFEKAIFEEVKADA